MSELQRDFFEEWVGEVVSFLPRKFYTWGLQESDWLAMSGGKFDNWCDKLFFFGKTPEQAAAIIQRAYKLYIKHD